MRRIASATALAAFAALLAAAPGRGEGERETFDWRACVGEATLRNPDLMAARAQVNKARANRTVVMSPVFPQIDAALRSDRTKVSGTDAVDAHSASLSGQQLLFDGFKTVFNTGEAGEQVVASRYNYAVVSSDVRLALRNAFVDLLTAQELLGISREIAARRKQNRELVELRYEAGREHRGALLLAKADLAQADYEVDAALRGIDLGERRLSTALGRTRLVPVAAEGDFAVVDAALDRPDFERMAGENPFLMKLISLTEAARYGVKSAKADFFPQIFGEIGAGRAGTSWPPKTDEWSLGVNLTYPLFEGRRRVGEVRRTLSALDQAESEEKSGRDGVITTLEETWTKLQNALEQAQVQKMYLEAGEERAKIARAQYAIGLILFDDWTIIEDTLVRAKNAYLAAEAASLVAEANWVQAQGGTLESEQFAAKP